MTRHLKHNKTVVIPHLDRGHICNWDLQQTLILLSCLWGPASSEKGDERGRKRAGLYSEARSPLEKSPGWSWGGTEPQRAPPHWGAPLSQINPRSEQEGRNPTATHNRTHAASHETVQKQGKSPVNVKLKKAAALVSIFGMNWRILLFQLQPTCWLSSAALRFCSFPFPGLSQTPLEGGCFLPACFIQILARALNQWQ